MKWQYMQLFVDEKEWWDSTGQNGEIRRLAERGIWNPAAGFPNLVPLMDRLGQDGWELAAAVGWSQSNAAYTFKRPTE